MVFQGFDKQQAEKVWQPFFDWVKGSPAALTIESVAVPRHILVFLAMSRI